MLRQALAGLRRSCNLPAFVLITHFRKRISIKIRKTKYLQQFQEPTKIPPPLEIPHCLKTGERQLVNMVR